MRTAKLFCVSLILSHLLLTGCQSTTKAIQAPPASNIKLSALFSDHMVLQQKKPLVVWGWADPGGTINVTIGGRKGTAISNEDGKWSTTLRSLSAGGPHTMTVSGKNTVTLRDVMVGEVWVCSGQSNMQMPVKIGNYGVFNAEQEVAAANYPNIRLLTVPTEVSFTPEGDTKSDGWHVCRPETVGPFSAVGYFFGRDLYNHMNVPIGVIHTSWGGTPAEAWTSKESLMTMPDFRQRIEEAEKLIPDLSRIDTIREEYEKKRHEWVRSLDRHDGGYEENRAAWAEPVFDASAWPSMDLPQNWEQAGLPGLDGFVWFRKEINIPENWVGKQLTLSLGPINDMNRTWFNGTQVGSHEVWGGWEKPSVYAVPGKLVKPGRNVIAVRVLDIGNLGGICGEAKQMKLDAEGIGSIPLAGAWQYKPGLDLKAADAPPMSPAVFESLQNMPGVLYNAMISPLLSYPIQGAIWYQGESNASRAYQYRTLFPLMIRDWRGKWGQGEFPFLFVQLANFLEPKSEPNESAWAELREAQLMTLSLPNTGMAVAIDIGEAKDIHPKNKQDVGKRLALAAQRIAYSEKLVFSGPIYKSMNIQGDVIRLRFEHVGGGLTAKRDGGLKGFAVAGENRKFVWANAKIEGNTVVVSSPEIRHPVAVRYAWAENPVCNLYNKEGLAASPFRTDSWKGITYGNQ
ncbi:MAG: sialate O-acetylesterase [bacterium]